jgi:hypothetical protein
MMRMVLGVYDYVGLVYVEEGIEIFLLRTLIGWCVLTGIPVFGVVCLFGNVSILLFAAVSLFLFLLPPLITMGFSEFVIWRKNRK